MILWNCRFNASYLITNILSTSEILHWFNDGYSKNKLTYLYTTVKLCEALLEGVATDDTLMVAVHQRCCGRFTNCRLFTADVEVTAALWAIFALFVWSTTVVSIVIPFEEGIIEVRVAVTANPLVNETLLLEALIVNATDVSAGVGGGLCDNTANKAGSQQQEGEES